MADDKTKRGSPDNKRLDKNDPKEVGYARSSRASPQRKAMLGEGASKSRAAGKKSASAKKGGSGRKSASAGKRTSAKKSASQRSAAPAMKRSNTAGARVRRTPTTRATPKPPKEQKTPENTAPKTMKEPDAVDLLTDDHLAVAALFNKYEKLTKNEAPAQERRSLAQSICDMLKVHTRIEEQIFYPAARSAGIDADKLDEANIEHASAKDLIAQIEIGNPNDELFDARVTVLGEYVRHHVVEEQTEIFPQCRRAGMDLVALRGELEARKMSLLPASDDDLRSEKAKPGLLSKLGDTLFNKSDRVEESHG